MARHGKRAMQRVAAAAITLMSVAAFGQKSGGVVVNPTSSSGSPTQQYQRFFALTPKGQVFVLQFDTQTGQLLQANQPVWTMEGVTAIAPAGYRQQYQVAGSFFAITSDRRIYYVDASGTSGARARLISHDAPADKTAIGYFGCNATLYTVPANGLLTTRTLSGWGADAMPTLLTAPIQSGTGWDKVSSAQCVQAYDSGYNGRGPGFNQVYATDAHGAVWWYRQSSQGMQGWTQQKTNLSYFRSPSFRGGVYVFGGNLVLEARYASGPGATRDRVTQGVRTAGDSDGITWPQGKAHTGIVTGGANLLDFTQVEYDWATDADIGKQ